MSEWKEEIIGDHIDLISGFAFKSADFLEEQIEGSLPVIKIKNVANGDVNLNDVVYHRYNPILEKFLLSEGDVLIAMTGNHPQAETQVVGDVSRYKLKERSLLNQRVGKIIVRDDANLDFIYYLFKNEEVRFYLANQSSGSANQANISKADILGLNLTIPQSNEQKAIASVLSSLDDKIDLLHRQNATLEKMAETLFRQWFVEEAKEEWEEKPMEDLLEFVVDNRGKTAPTSDSGVPLIATNCIKNNNIFPIYEKVRYVSDETYNNWFRSHPKPGDVIFVNKGTPGCINLVPDPIDFCIAQDMISLRVRKELISNYFLFIFLRLESTQIDILNASVGTTIPHLKKTDLLKFIIPVPPNGLMNEFTSRVEPLFVKMNNNQTQIRTLTAMRDNLLPKLMSGEVRVEIKI